MPAHAGCSESTRATPQNTEVWGVAVRHVVRRQALATVCSPLSDQVDALSHVTMRVADG
jgi:hypothetical protein